MHSVVRWGVKDLLKLRGKRGGANDEGTRLRLNGLKNVGIYAMKNVELFSNHTCK
jgi:hypothetical protein